MNLLLAVLLALDTLTVSSPRGTRAVPILTERGYPAVASASLGSVLTWEARPSPAGTANLRVAGQSFVFVIGAGYFRSNDRVYTLASPPYLSRDSLFLPLQFVAEYLPRLTSRFRYDASRLRLEELADGPADRQPPTADSPRPAAGGQPPANRRRVVAIDAGHGGVDVGMTGPIRGSKFLREKDVTLAIARALSSELRARGYGTIMTRDRDTLIALVDRGRIAGRGSADIFVSIHVNAANPRWRNAATARGFETYFLAEGRTEDENRVARMENASVRFETDAHAERGDPLSFIITDLAQNEHLRESSRMATLVQSSLDDVHPAPGRGVKQAGFAVLATSYMPAVLIETGFGSNVEEARYLTSRDGQQRIAKAIADGIVRYLGEYERRVTGP